MNRGDVVLVYYPFATGVGGSRRPALVVQSDNYNRRIQNTIVAQITTNLRNAGAATHFLIETQSPAGSLSGLLHDSVVSCINLVTVDGQRISQQIGKLPPEAMTEIDACLKAALGLA